MASSYSDLGIELMATGENAGTWGTKTNTNLQIVEKSIAGYVEKAITSGGTTALTITDGDATESTSVARHAVIKLTGTISGNSIVTVPDSIEKVYIVVNGTSGAYTVQFKTASGTGITFGTTDKGTRLLFSDGTNIVDTGFSTSVAADDISTGDAAVTIATSSGDITVDGPSDIILDADGGDIFFKDGGTTFGSATNTSGNLIIKSGTTTAVTFSGANATVAGNLSVGGDFDVTGSLDFSDANITNVGSIALDTITNDGTDITLDSSGDIVLDADGADIFLKDAGTTYGSLTNSSGNLIVKSGTTTALTFSGADVTIAGDLTVSGDDITMGTNTAGNLLIADGTNFNSVAVGSLSEISTVASDDVLLAVDTSGGGLKKITRATLTAGIVSGSEISNVVEDSTPQLGGDLDVNGNGLTSTSNGNIALTPNGTGVVRIDGSSGIDMQSGSISIKNSGAQSYIDFYCESSNAHYARLQAPAHSAFSGNVTLTLPATTDTIAGIAATQTLTNKTLTSPKINEDVAVTSTATELNLLDGVTATTTELNLIDGGSSIGTTAIADGDGIIHNDGGTMKVTSAATFKTYFTSGVSSAADDLTAGDAAVNITTSSGNITIDAAANDSDIIFKGTDNSSDITMLTLDGSEAGKATFNDQVVIGDGKLVLNSTAVTSTAAELNLLDGVSGLVQADLTKLAAVDSTAAELNIVDGGTSATSTTVADADRVVLNDNGTMVQVAMTDIKTYIGGGTSWQAVKTSNFTAAAGQGVFCNTTGGAFTLTLPASPSIGDEVSFVDYAGTFDTNNLTIGRNSSKIHGATEDLTIAVERAANTLVFTDSTQGWLLKSK